MPRCRWLLPLLVYLLSWGCAPGEESDSGVAFELKEYGDLGGDFALTDHEGRPFRLAQLRGRLALLFFGYTHCPDFCPMTLSKLTRAFDLLGERREEVSTLFVSVDPERDGPEELRGHLEQFPVNGIGLTGSAARIDSIARRYGVTYARRESGSAAGYFVDHSTYTFLIDQQGKIRYIFRHGDAPELIAAGVAKLLLKEE
jgi:protein SCO1